jgi:hypothetical protein
LSDTPHLDVVHPADGVALQAVVVANGENWFDAVVMPAVINRTATAAPGSPTEGDRYIAATGVAGWTGTRNGVAAQTFVAGDFITSLGGGWVGWAPEEGWVAAVAAEDIFVVHNGTSWVYHSSYKVAAAVSGATAVQSTATQLGFGISRVTVSTATDSAVKLPAAEAGAECIVINEDAADNVLLYPASGDEINNLGANAALTLVPNVGKMVILRAVDATNWYGVLSA